MAAFSFMTIVSCNATVAWHCRWRAQASRRTSVTACCRCCCCWWWWCWWCWCNGDSGDAAESDVTRRVCRGAHWSSLLSITSLEGVAARLLARFADTPHSAAQLQDCQQTLYYDCVGRLRVIMLNDDSFMSAGSLGSSMDLATTPDSPSSLTSKV